MSNNADENRRNNDLKKHQATKDRRTDKLLDPDKYQFSTLKLIVGVAVLCGLLAALVSGHSVLIMTAIFLVWIAFEVLQVWIVTVIEQWFGDK